MAHVTLQGTAFINKFNDFGDLYLVRLVLCAIDDIQY